MASAGGLGLDHRALDRAPPGMTDLLDYDPDACPDCGGVGWWVEGANWDGPGEQVWCDCRGFPGVVYDTNKPRIGGHQTFDDHGLCEVCAAPRWAVMETPMLTWCDRPSHPISYRHLDQHGVFKFEVHQD